MKTLSELMPQDLQEMLGKKCDAEGCNNAASHMNEYTGNPEKPENLCEEHFIENNEEWRDRFEENEENKETGN